MDQNTFQVQSFLLILKHSKGFARLLYCLQCIPALATGEQINANPFRPKRARRERIRD